MMVSSTACRLMTGRTPGMPKQTGQTWVLGGESGEGREQEQNILLRVSSCAWTSSPMTVSYWTAVVVMAQAEYTRGTEKTEQVYLPST